MIDPGSVRSRTSAATWAPSWLIQSAADTSHVTMVMSRRCTSHDMNGVRWPWGGRKKPGHTPRVALEGVLGAVELGIARVEPAPVVVVVGVVAEQLAVVVEGPGDVGPGVEGLADGEERALHAVGVEDVADLAA